MICLTCHQKITQNNRQTYRLGLRLPYCKNCVEAYIAYTKIKEMNPEQKKRFIIDTKKKLKETVYTAEEKEQAIKKMKEIGLSEKEIQEILT